MSSSTSRRISPYGRVACDPSDEERSHPPLEPALAGVLAQGPAELGRVNPHLQRTDPFAQSRQLAVNGILKALDERLQMRDPRLERAQLILPGTARRDAPALIRIHEGATELPDPGDQALTFAHAHRRRSRFGWGATGG